LKYSSRKTAIERISARKKKTAMKSKRAETKNSAERACGYTVTIKNLNYFQILLLLI
jgi:hypothetical protein